MNSWYGTKADKITNPENYPLTAKYNPPKKNGQVVEELGLGGTSL